MIKTPSWTDEELKKAAAVIKDFKAGKVKVLTE